MKLTQYETTGSKDKQIFARKTVSLFPLSKVEIEYFSLLLLDSGICLPINKGNYLNFKANQKLNCKKS